MRPTALARRLAELGGRAVDTALGLTALLVRPLPAGRLFESVSLPRLRQHRLRAALTLSGIALGVAVLVAVVLLGRSIVRSVSETLDEIGGRADLTLSAGTTGFSEDVLEAVLATPGVATATPVVEQTARLVSDGAAGERLLILGVDVFGDADERFRSYASSDLEAIKEDPLLFLNSRTNLLVTRSLARRLGVGVHQTITLVTPSGREAFTVWGILEDEGIGRAFGGRVALMYYQAAQVAFSRGDQIDRIDVALEDRAAADAVVERLRARTGDRLRIERPTLRNERQLKMLVALRTGLTVASLVAILVGMFLIYNTMAIAVVQRRRELGILRALGITRGQILRLVTLEGLLFGLSGSLAGVALGLGLARLLLADAGRSVSELYLQVAVTELAIDPLLVAAAFALGVGAAVLSSLAPAREAMAVQPVAILRTGAALPSAPRRRRLGTSDLAALALLGLAPPLLHLPAHAGLPFGAYAAALCLMLGGALLAPRALALTEAVAGRLGDRLGVALRLASDSLRRNQRRANVTVAALLCGVAMSVAVAVFVGSFVRSTVEWIDQTIPADLHVTSGSRFAGVRSMPMEDRLYAPLAALRGVAAVERLRIADLVFAELPVKLLSTDTEVFARRARLTMFAGDADAAIVGLLAGDVLVSETLTRRLGITTSDTVTLSTAGGPRDYRIAGVIVDYTSDMGTIFIDRAPYVRDFGDARVDTYKLYLHPSADLEAVRGAIEARFGAEHDLFVLSYREFRAGVVDLLEQVFALMHALELVALLIAVLGVVNALLASVLDRVREIGVLRAVGMRRAQVQRVVMVEGTLIGLAALIVGLAAGLLLGQVLLGAINLVQTGWYFPFRVPWTELAEISALVLAVATAAGTYPARLAAGLVVSEALEVE